MVVVVIFSMLGEERRGEERPAQPSVHHTPHNDQLGGQQSVVGERVSNGGVKTPD